MKKKVLIIAIIVSVIGISELAFSCIFGRLLENSDFEIHFIDVGQGDAALVICDGESMLIDGGNVNDSGMMYTYLKNRDIDHLNYIVATHAHEDHIGGLAGALNYATVDTVLCPVTSYDNDTFDDFIKYIEYRNTEITVPVVGDEFNLGEAKVKILGCNASGNTNDTSIILKITYGNTSFLFTGDAEREAENAVIESGVDLDSTVLKVGHHGADSSTSYLFLREVMPRYAIISVGENNDCGHPTEEVLSRLRDAGVTVYRTDIQGTIICKSDGNTVEFRTYKNSDADTLAEISNGKSETVNFETLFEDTENTETYSQETDPAETGLHEKTPTYILNINPSSLRFHIPSCKSVDNMKEKNKKLFYGTREEAIKLGYTPCGSCKP